MEAKETHVYCISVDAKETKQWESEQRESAYYQLEITLMKGKWFPSDAVLSWKG